METLSAFLIDEHIKDLHRAARGERLARSASVRHAIPGWRRQAASAARRLSLALDGVATQLDRHPGRPSYGRE